MTAIWLTGREVEAGTYTQTLKACCMDPRTQRVSRGPSDSQNFDAFLVSAGLDTPWRRKKNQDLACRCAVAQATRRSTAQSRATVKKPPHLHSMEFRMSRFYFKAHDGVTIGDEDGRELPTEEAALREALRLAAHLMSLEASKAKLGMNWWLEVADDRAVVLFRININVSRLAGSGQERPTP